MRNNIILVVRQLSYFVAYLLGFQIGRIIYYPKPIETAVALFGIGLLLSYYTVKNIFPCSILNNFWETRFDHILGFIIPEGKFEIKFSQILVLAYWGVIITSSTDHIMARAVNIIAFFFAIILTFMISQNQNSQ